MVQVLKKEEIKRPLLADSMNIYVEFPKNQQIVRVKFKKLSGMEGQCTKVNCVSIY